MYGYVIHKIYQQVFPPCTREVIYYHLNKGLHLDVFTITEIRQEKGDYSWGSVVEKRFFGLGKNAAPQGVSQELQDKINQLVEGLPR